MKRSAADPKPPPPEALARNGAALLSELSPWHYTAVRTHVSTAGSPSCRPLRRARATRPLGATPVRFCEGRSRRCAAASGSCPSRALARVNATPARAAHGPLHGLGRCRSRGRSSSAPRGRTAGRGACRRWCVKSHWPEGGRVAAVAAAVVGRAIPSTAIAEHVALPRDAAHERSSRRRARLLRSAHVARMRGRGLRSADACALAAGADVVRFEDIVDAGGARRRRRARRRSCARARRTDSGRAAMRPPALARAQARPPRVGARPRAFSRRTSAPSSSRRAASRCRSRLRDSGAATAARAARETSSD